MARKKRIFLPLHYPYYGTSNQYVRIEQDNSPLGGWTELYSDFGEKMFEGITQDSILFMNDLINKKYI